MSVGANQPLMGVSHRGSTRDNLPQFKTYSSAACEPAAFDPEARNVVIGALSFGITVILLCLGAIELLK